MNMHEAMDRLTTAFPKRASIDIVVTLKRPAQYNEERPGLARESAFSINIHNAGAYGSIEGNNLAGLVAAAIQRFGPVQDASAAAECVTRMAAPTLGQAQTAFAADVGVPPDKLVKVVEAHAAAIDPYDNAAPGQEGSVAG